MDRLRAALGRIDGRGYPAYKDIRGTWFGADFTLEVVHVQGDPFAAPSSLAVRFPVDLLDLDPDDLEIASRRVGIEDGLLRSFSRALRAAPRGRGSGKSGRWEVVRLGQEILPRSGCEIVGDEVTVRFTLGLPAQGRRVLGREAARLLCDQLPGLVRAGLLEADVDRLLDHADASEDQEVLRAMLAQNAWVAFIADGAILPRRSGVDDRPLGDGAVPWSSPEALRATIELPCAGPVSGSALPQGVTLICGGGYHGKSTLLSALARGIYNHVPGDGRERVVCSSRAVQVRAEDGRSVSAVDISPFIANLPDGRDTRAFTTPNASGSTSQAACIIESLELGADCLLIDEDTSATNFMIRDRRMQELIATDREPITAFVDRVRPLSDAGVSCVLVIGGCGDYFDVADLVLVMDAYEPAVRTADAHRIAADLPSNRREESAGPFPMPAPRTPDFRSFETQTKRGRGRARARDTREIQVGEQNLDISLIAQLIDPGQAKTIADLLLAPGTEASLATFAERASVRLAERGVSSVTTRGAGDRVWVRSFELAAAINRLRSLRLIT